MGSDRCLMGDGLWEMRDGRCLMGGERCPVAKELFATGCRQGFPVYWVTVRIAAADVLVPTCADPP
ncbi:hypothetical protein Acy02nite_32010 [Actinoplanes cyaneus]|uniref:Uncharacterized protein n=1 Tax=Actinoplanes cyaneus TaxID=52696 RepID=A0A919INN4_9ACTN|nr:hypothetical protein [Actinoplanes cyaneus]GID65320.1 hypothetical protein Acy02nite_32010 [Actinoplanes cyaneus]